MQRKNFNASSEAKKVWELFHAKYAELIRSSNAIEYEFLRKEKQKEEFHEKDREEGKEKESSSHDLDKVSAIKIIQSHWRKRASKDTHVPVLLNQHRSPRLLFFLNGQQIFKSINKKKLGQLFFALAKNDWSDPIFTDSELPHLALNLYDAGKISEHQFYTLIEREQENVKTYRILNSQGNLSPAFMQAALPAINEANFRTLNNGLISTIPPALSKQKLETFRLLIAELPPSEQTFYLTKDNCSESGSEHKTLKNAVYNLGAVYIFQDKVVNLSAGARDALGIARYGLDEYIRPIDRLGVQSLNQMQRIIRVGYARPRTIKFPGAEFPSVIHEYKKVDKDDAARHDDFHCLMMCILPNKILEALWHMTDVVREGVEGLEWSKSTWTWTDAELSYLINSQDLETAFYSFAFEDKKSMETRELKPFCYLMRDLTTISTEYNTDLFCRILSHGRHSTDYASHGSYLFISKNIMVAGIMIMIDLIKNPDLWRHKFNIDPRFFIGETKNSLRDKLISPFKYYFDHISAIYHLIQHDSPKIQILKCQLFFELLKNYKKDEHLCIKDFKAICEWINQNKKMILENLNFVKISKEALEKDKNLRTKFIPHQFNFVRNSKIINLITLERSPELEKLLLQAFPILEKKESAKEKVETSVLTNSIFKSEKEESEEAVKETSGRSHDQPTPNAPSNQYKGKND